MDQTVEQQVVDSHIPLSAMPVRPDSYGAMQARKMMRLARDGNYGVTTGISSLDKYLRFFPATYTIIGAQPGGGKTALAMQLLGHAFHVSRQRGDNKRALIFSAEMTEAQLSMRDISSITGVSVWDQLRGKVNDEQAQQLEEAYQMRIENPRYHVDPSPSPDAQQLATSCGLFAQTGGLSMVMLDYIELASTDESFKAEHVREVGKMCKEIAKRYDCPVIALSQINKDNTARADKKPAMTDIRYGGHEIADAVVILKHNEETIVSDGIKHIEGHIVKNRNGPGVGMKADMLFNGAAMSFASADIEAKNLSY